MKKNKKRKKNIEKRTTFINLRNIPKINMNQRNHNSAKNILEINNNNIHYDNDYELNSLSYINALKYDKRTCCEYYISLIKSKQLFAFTFCSFTDYNSGIIKKYILFLSFALHYTINTLFFTDANMHQIYEDEGQFNFSYQFPKILISAICSTVILRIILITLVLTDKSIIKIKNQTKKELALKMKKNVIKCIKIKLGIFFVVNFILLTLFWYYLTCFNGVYQNTQIYLIENTFISFGFSLAYHIIINIFPSVVRYCSLAKKNTKNKIKDGNFLFSLSKILQIL